MRKLFIVSILTSLFLATGCSSFKSDTKYVVDKEHVYHVNTAAKSGIKNVQVIWVNPPKKRVENK